MMATYEMAVYVIIERVEQRTDGLLFPERAPIIGPIGCCPIMISPQALKDAEAMSAIFRVTEEKLIKKILEEADKLGIY